MKPRMSVTSDSALTFKSYKTTTSFKTAGNTDDLEFEDALMEEAQV